MLIGVDIGCGGVMIWWCVRAKRVCGAWRCDDVVRKISKLNQISFVGIEGE